MEVFQVIKYCHEMGVVHRDLKPDNILLSASGKIMIADFGLAMRISSGQTLTGLARSPASVALWKFCWAILSESGHMERWFPAACPLTGFTSIQRRLLGRSF